jgi:hypothetical protein
MRRMFSAALSPLCAFDGYTASPYSLDFFPVPYMVSPLWIISNLVVEAGLILLFC